MVDDTNMYALVLLNSDIVVTKSNRCLWWILSLQERMCSINWISMLMFLSLRASNYWPTSVRSLFWSYPTFSSSIPLSISKSELQLILKQNYAMYKEWERIFLRSLLVSTAQPYDKMTCLEESTRSHPTYKLCYYKRRSQAKLLR